MTSYEANHVKGKPQPVTLAVRMGPLRLTNPVVAASGTFGFGTEYAGITDVSRLGAIVTKTITLERRMGNPPPRILETPSGMLNSVGLENPGVRAFIARYLPALRQSGVPVIVSIAGTTPTEFARLARILDKQKGIAALELNVSCPNVARGGATVGCSQELTRITVAAVRAVTRFPLIAKLPPNVTSIVSVAHAALEAGANIIAAINTLKALAVDWRRQRAVLGGFTGGLSGPAIKPVALHAVWEIFTHCRCPIMGIGGIMCADDVLEFIVAGASAVQVGTANFVDPAVTTRIISDLCRILPAAGRHDISSLIGTLKSPPRVPRSNDPAR